MLDSEISEYLNCVDRSAILGKSTRRLKLLEYLLNAEQEGNGANLKAYSIGIDVLDKPFDFDPSIDSSVRVEMGRMRTALASFEMSEYATSRISVEIPVGSYRPIITQRSLENVDGKSDQPTSVKRKRSSYVVALATAAICFALFSVFLNWREKDEPRQDDHAVVVSIAPFVGDGQLAAQVEAALRRSLVRSRIVATTSQTLAGDSRSDFLLRGLVSRAQPTSNNVAVELLNLATDRVVWTKTIKVDLQADIEERVAEDVGRELRVRLLGASKEFLEGRDPKRLTPQQLFVMATWVPGPATNSVSWERERISLMEAAFEKDPNNGPAHSVMADKLRYLANVDELSNTQELREEANMHARRALELDPLNPDVVFNVAQSQWHAGKMKQSEVTMRRVVELDPGHDLARFLSMVIPYTCATPPDDVVAQAIEFDTGLSADNPIRWLTLTWISWLQLNARDYQAALEAEQRAAVIFETPYGFMRHALLLNKLNRPDEAVEWLQRHRDNWPDTSPDHFASVTLPRQCDEAPQGQVFIKDYEEFAEAISDRL